MYIFFRGGCTPTGAKTTMKKWIGQESSNQGISVLIKSSTSACVRRLFERKIKQKKPSTWSLLRRLFEYDQQESSVLLPPPFPEPGRRASPSSGKASTRTDRTCTVISIILSAADRVDSVPCLEAVSYRNIYSGVRYPPLGTHPRGPWGCMVGRRGFQHGLVSRLLMQVLNQPSLGASGKKLFPLSTAKSDLRVPTSTALADCFGTEARTLNPHASLQPNQPCYRCCCCC